MFNIGPMELVVIALVGLIVLGPDKLPNLARDAARMLRTLRELATGARSQLREELGPEFSNLDLQALRDLRALNPRTALRDLILGGEDDVLPTRSDIESAGRENGTRENGTRENGSKPSMVKRDAEPAEPTRYDDDAT